MTRSPLTRETVDFGATTLGVSGGPALGLTLLQHPNLARVGEVAVLFPAGLPGSARVSRTEPAFGPPGSAAGKPLEHPAISRSPLSIALEASGTITLAADAKSKVVIGGVPLAKPLDLAPAELERGVVIELSAAVVLLLHHVAAGKDEAPHWGLRGESLAIRALRAEIRKVADADTPVLIRGESGAGKELVARALHEQSPRGNKPFVAVNLAAIPPTIAASMLFGHVRGAFTGAETASPGFFRSAQGGSLFLDELGELPDEVQPLLLRAIREGEVQPAGDMKTYKVDVRVISATDADVDAMVERGELRMPLLRRLEGYTILVPPLRARRDDLARLFFEFLRAELSAIGEAHKLNELAPERKPWLPTRVIADLLEYDWPGNVAELATVARRIALTNRGQERFAADSLLERRFSRAAAPDVRAPEQPAERPSEKPSSRGGIHASDAEICEAMAAHDYDVRATALALGVSHSWFHKRLETCQGLRRAKELAASEILPLATEHGWDVAAMARALRVSPHGLKLRITALKLR